jgi:hypothetical protein
MAAARAAAALVVALIAVLAAAHGVRAQHPELMNHTSSGAARQLRGSGGWLPAKATWYGAPNGAGPDDNGTYARVPDASANRDDGDRFGTRSVSGSNAVADIVSR